MSMPQVIVLNGTSSSGKSALALSLQEILPTPWVRLSIDDLIARVPASLVGSPSGIRFAEDGSVQVGATFRELEAAWMAGLRAMAQAGMCLMIDDVFLNGGATQARVAASFAGTSVLWVGVHCSPEVTAARERARGDRVVGMAARQASVVHEGVTYDVEVDTSVATPRDCATDIIQRVGFRP